VPGGVQDALADLKTHWEFLFALSFLCGGYVLHALSRISEGAAHSERAVVQELVAEASRSLAQLSPIDGLKDVLLMPLGRLRDRRLRNYSKKFIESRGAETGAWRGEVHGGQKTSG